MTFEDATLLMERHAREGFTDPYGPDGRPGAEPAPASLDGRPSRDPSPSTEEDPKLARAQHDQKLQTVGMLAASIAHDFNNLLTAVLGHASLLAETLPDDHPERGSVSEIIAGSQQAARLAKQLLSFTRTGAAERTELDLNEVARDSYSLLRRIIGVDVQLQLDLEKDLCPVHADPAQIAQVLMNLIMNARDALPGGRGHVCIRTRNYEEAPDGEACRYAMIEVEDDGVGMDQATQARIFEPFYSTKVERQGTGLGMAIVDSIVRRHDGHIAVDSSPGKGTRMRVLIPAAD